MSRNVVIAGGGVAAVEAALTLRRVAGAQVRVSLLAPNRTFELAPDTVAEAAGGPAGVRFDLGAMAADLDVELVEDALESVDAGARTVVARSGRRFEYDALLLALGVRPGAVLHGALRFAGRPDVTAVRSALDRAERLPRPRIAFAATGGVGWTLPLYELALLVAARLDAIGRRGELTIVTPEGEPLALFGHAASQEVARRLAQSHIRVRTGTVAESADEKTLWLAIDGSMPVDLVIALPEPVGPNVPGVPSDSAGFVPVDRFGHVEGLTAVWAAGDITARPLKQGGLATQQAEAAALSIAAWAGADVEPRPYEPVLRGMLLTAAAPEFLRRVARSTVPSAVSDRPSWSPAIRVAGRRLGPYLAAHPGFALGPAPGQTSARGRSLNVVAAESRPPYA